MDNIDKFVQLVHESDNIVFFGGEDGTGECQVNLDEDDLARMLSGSSDSCPYFQMDDEYKIVRKQM